MIPGMETFFALTFLSNPLLLPTLLPGIAAFQLFGALEALSRLTNAAFLNELERNKSH
jgi:hypothetical protein